MLSANEILKSDSGKIADTYQEITGKQIDGKCGDCIRDARVVIQAYFREQERLSEPIHIYLINPSEESLWQNHNNPQVSKVTQVESFTQAFDLFEDNAVNIIAQNAFFDETISLVKQIKPYQAYALDAYLWNGNGHATLMKNNPCAWVFRGKVKKRIALPDLNRSGYVVTNPCINIHLLVNRI